MALGLSLVCGPAGGTAASEAKGLLPLILRPNLGSHSSPRLRLPAFLSKGLNLGRTQGAVEKKKKKTQKTNKVYLIREPLKAPGFCQYKKAVKQQGRGEGEQAYKEGEGTATNHMTHQSAFHLHPTLVTGRQKTSLSPGASSAWFKQGQAELSERDCAPLPF